MSSRRDSRVHLSVRQSDALLEFENFKRKYLLVNKHITKLNSTLSVRVEELNAQVSTLYVENLRLRASEISLASQLKKEKERSRQVMADAESAVNTLMEQLSNVRASLGIPIKRQSPYSPRSRRKTPPSPVQPPRESVRLVKPPAETITQIRESDEEDADDDDDTPTRTVNTWRPSTSRLPLPKLAPVPQKTSPVRPSLIPNINLAAEATKRKPVRRNSSLLTIEHRPDMVRALSPVMGISIRSRRGSVEQHEDEEQEVELELDVQVETEPTLQADCPIREEKVQRVDEVSNRTDLGETKKVIDWPRKADRKGKAKQLQGEWERETDILSSERDSSEGAKEKDRRRCGIKDVTNSPRKGPTEFVDEKQAEMGAVSPTTSTLTASSITTSLFDTLTVKPSASSLYSATSTPATDHTSDPGDGSTGRERRTRKSVNYAEPKLNTKMRKPDPPSESLKPRSSAGNTRRRKSIPALNPVLASDEDGDADIEGSISKTRWTECRRRTVHNTSVNTPEVPSSLGNFGTGGDTYGIWSDETRRRSMAV